MSKQGSNGPGDGTSGGPSPKLAVLRSGGILPKNEFYRSFQGGGRVAVSSWEALSDGPIQRARASINSINPMDEEFDDGPLSHTNAMLASLLKRNKEGVVEVNPNITTDGRSVSTLERLFHKIQPGANFHKFFSFLAQTAEAESLSGEKLSNPKSSATGDFHILTGNNKNGKTSSFDTGKQRIKNLKKKLGNDLSSDPEILEKLDTILEAKSPLDLTMEEQSMFVLVDLKMKSKNLNDFLSDRISAAELYSKEWVTEGSENHTKDGVITNWGGAGTRRANDPQIQAKDEKYFGISVYGKGKSTAEMKKEVEQTKFNQQEKKKGLSPIYRSGGRLGFLERPDEDVITFVRNRNKLF